MTSYPQTCMHDVAIDAACDKCSAHDLARAPLAEVRVRDIPSISMTAGLPTAQSRIDIFKSKFVIVPLAQDPALHERKLPVFEPVEPNRRRVALLAAIWGFIAASAILAAWYMLVR